jgi:hypothetical protein
MLTRTMLWHLQARENLAFCSQQVIFAVPVSNSLCAICVYVLEGPWTLFAAAYVTVCCCIPQATSELRTSSINSRCSAEVADDAEAQAYTLYSQMVLGIAGMMLAVILFVTFCLCCVKDCVFVENWSLRKSVKPGHKRTRSEVPFVPKFSYSAREDDMRAGVENVSHVKKPPPS